MKLYRKVNLKIQLVGWLLLSIVWVGKTQNLTELKFDELAVTVDSLIEKRAFDQALEIVNPFDPNKLSDDDRAVFYHQKIKIFSPRNSGNFDSCIHYINLSFPLLKSDSIIAGRHMMLGNLLVFKGDFQNANHSFNEVLKGLKYIPKALDSIQLFSRLAFTYGALGQAEEQLVWLEKINEVLEHTDDDFAKVIGYFDQINYHNSQNNGDKIKELLPYLKKSGLKSKDSVLVSNVSKAIASCYRREDNFELDSAAHYSILAIDYLSSRNIPTEKYNLKIGLANTYFFKKEFEKAISLCKESIAGLVAAGQHQTGEIGTAYSILAWSFEETDELEKAEQFYRKKLELDRLQDNDLYLEETLSDLIRVLKAQGKTGELNDFYEEILVLKDSIFTQLNTQQISDAETRLGLTLKEQELENQNLRLEQQKKQQTWSFMLIGLLTLLLGGAFWAYRRIFRDKKLISNQKEQLEKSLTEKEFLLKEIHHRVKNNLQIISSLLDKQARNSADNTLKQLMREGKDRIQSMALIHQNLYQSDDLSAIEIQKYIQELTQTISDSHQEENQNIEINIDAEPIQLEIDQAIPLGLILNELLTNTFKHGFKNLKEGIVNVKFWKNPNNQFELIFSDSGHGMPSGFDLKKAKSLGLNLVNGLVQQLDGTLSFESSGSGTNFNIQF